MRQNSTLQSGVSKTQLGVLQVLERMVGSVSARKTATKPAPKTTMPASRTLYSSLETLSTTHPLYRKLDKQHTLQ